MLGFITRPNLVGKKGVVTSGHYLASVAGFRMLEAGGNAIDAAASMNFCLNLLKPHYNGLGGEVPILIYSSIEKKVFAISGMGWSPCNLELEWYKNNNIDLIPGDGFLPTCVPAVFDSWALALARFGTMSFSQVLQPAIELAEEGFPIYQGLQRGIEKDLERITQHYPTTAEIYCPNGRIPEVGEVLRNPDFGKVLRTLCDAEQGARAKGRLKMIGAARDEFYNGRIADKILEYLSDTSVQDASGKSHKSFLSASDLSGWRATVEETVALDFHGYEVHKCSYWTQGPVFLQQLAILEGFDLGAMGHNSAEYLHILIETAKLAFSDREAYYGDPLFDSIPSDVLLSKEYAENRRGLINSYASSDLRPGEIENFLPPYDLADVRRDNRHGLQLDQDDRLPEGRDSSHSNDTTHLDVIDSQGNMVAATPSGGWIGTSPVIPGLGFSLSTRGQMFYLNPRRANALEPMKRPRTTLTPSLVLKNSKPYMVFGTPGGDCQDQWTLQFFLNHIVFGMNLQQAVDAPSIHILHFPSSFYPREAFPRRVVVEGRIDEATRSSLEKKGHELVMTGSWENGNVMAINLNANRSLISGAVSPRRIVGYAIGW